MATEIYTPPTELPVTSKLYSPPSDATGTATYEDPNKPTFQQSVQLVGRKPTIVVA